MKLLITMSVLAGVCLFAYLHFADRERMLKYLSSRVYNDPAAMHQWKKILYSFPSSPVRDYLLETGKLEKMNLEKLIDALMDEQVVRQR